MALFSALGATIGFAMGMSGPISVAAASVIGTSAVAAGVGATGAAISGIGAAMASPGNQAAKAYGATPLPIKSVADITDVAKITATAKAISKRSAIARSRTVFTSPMGITEEATTAKKTLLGQ